MMWQEIIVGICVILAAGYLLRRYCPGLRPTGAKEGSCGSCQGCGNKKGSGGCASR